MRLACFLCTIILLAPQFCQGGTLQRVFLHVEFADSEQRGSHQGRREDTQKDTPFDFSDFEKNERIAALFNFFELDPMNQGLRQILYRIYVDEPGMFEVLEEISHKNPDVVRLPHKLALEKIFELAFRKFSFRNPTTETKYLKRLFRDWLMHVPFNSKDFAFIVTYGNLCLDQEDSSHSAQYVDWLPDILDLINNHHEIRRKLILALIKSITSEVVTSTRKAIGTGPADSLSRSKSSDVMMAIVPTILKLVELGRTQEATEILDDFTAHFQPGGDSSGRFERYLDLKFSTVDNELANKRAAEDETKATEALTHAQSGNLNPERLRDLYFSPAHLSEFILKWGTPELDRQIFADRFGLKFVHMKADFLRVERFGVWPSVQRKTFGPPMPLTSDYLGSEPRTSDEIAGRTYFVGNLYRFPLREDWMNAFINRGGVGDLLISAKIHDKAWVDTYFTNHPDRYFYVLDQMPATERSARLWEWIGDEIPGKHVETSRNQLAISYLRKQDSETARELIDSHLTDAANFRILGDKILPFLDKQFSEYKRWKRALVAAGRYQSNADQARLFLRTNAKWCTAWMMRLGLRRIPDK